MEERNRQNMGNISLDIPYLIRRIMRNAVVIFLCAVIAGIGAYVAFDNYLQDSYTAKVNLRVLPRDNNSAKLAEGNVNSAAVRNVNVLNSDTMKEMIKKSPTAEGVQGNVYAAQVTGTNLISLSADSDSAEHAFRLLKAATENYPKLAGYFESGYVVNNLENFSVDSIVKNQAQPLKYALAVLMLVILAGVGLTVLIEMLSDKIYSREQAENLLDMDILSELHYVKKKRGQKALLVSDTTTDPVFMEEMDKLTTCFQQKMKHRNYKVAVVSSIRENEGKTTLAANLALSLIKRGKKVLIMDADLRKPALARIFDEEVKEGNSLTDFLEGKTELNQIMIRPEDKKGLICLWQKQAVPEADRLLEGERLKNAIQMFRRHVDYIIIDTPPIGIVRDTEILASLAEATVLSLRESEERAAAVNDVVDMLEDAGTTVLGGVINMTRGVQGVQRRSRYGKYYYGYGNRKNGDE